MKHNTIPWFVFNNRTDRNPASSHDLIQHRRAVVLTVCFMVMLGCLLALAAGYCPPAFYVVLSVLATIGAGSLFRAVYRYTRGD